MSVPPLDVYVNMKEDLADFLCKRRPLFWKCQGREHGRVLNRSVIMKQSYSTDGAFFFFLFFLFFFWKVRREGGKWSKVTKVLSCYLNHLPWSWT